MAKQQDGIVIQTVERETGHDSNWSVPAGSTATG